MLISLCEDKMHFDRRLSRSVDFHFCFLSPMLYRNRSNYDLLPHFTASTVALKTQSEHESTLRSKVFMLVTVCCMLELFV